MSPPMSTPSSSNPKGEVGAVPRRGGGGGGGIGMRPDRDRMAYPESSASSPAVPSSGKAGRPESPDAPRGGGGGGGTGKARAALPAPPWLTAPASPSMVITKSPT